MLAVITDGYFATLDRGDAEAAAACFTPDAVLECVGVSSPLRGQPAIAAFLRQIVGESLEMTHDVERVILDVARGRAVTELHYLDRLKDGRIYDMRNVNIFEFGDGARFQRVDFWLGGKL